MELQDFIKCLKDKAIDHREYFHYTTVDKYLKMQTPVKLPDGETHRMLWLTPATATNDGMERKYGDHAYLGCFTYSPYESVGMWFMYGNPKKNAIRIGFDNQSLTEWRKRNINEKDHRRTIKAYGIDFDSNGVPIYHEIQSAMIEDVCLCDVAYVLSKEDVEHHRWPKSVEWRRDYHEVRSDNLEIVSKKGSLLYSNDFTDKTCSKLPFCFKKKGWSNEREVRIVVSLKPEAAQWKHVAIPFDGPLAFVESHKKEYIVLGPWHEDGDMNGIVDERSVGRSIFMGELANNAGKGNGLVQIKAERKRPVRIEIKTWGEFYRLADWFAENDTTWVFRGHRDKSWNLETTFERKHHRIKILLPDDDATKKKLTRDVLQKGLDGIDIAVRKKESGVIQAFRKMISWEHNMGDNWHSYVMAMQHYEAPTRLLDFTYSLFTALYFAFAEDDIEGERAIWAVNLDAILKWVQDNCKKFPTEESNGIRDCIAVAEDVFTELIKHVEEPSSNKYGLIPVLTPNNPRMLAQKGIFLMPLKNSLFMNNLCGVFPFAVHAHSSLTPQIERRSVDEIFEKSSSLDVGLVKIEFAEELRHTAKKILMHANIDKASLFPDTREDRETLERIRDEIEHMLEKGLY